MGTGAILVPMRKCKGKCDGPKIKGVPIDSITKPRYNPKKAPKIPLRKAGKKGR